MTLGDTHSPFCYGGVTGQEAQMRFSEAEG